jgi:chromosome partitioning protein
MRIIAVMSPKGGIGKTTTSDAIAYMLGEEQEKRVLILDGDPQAIHQRHLRHTSRREQE